MEKLIDKIDINDKVIGTTTRPDAHAHGYPHRVACAFVFDPRGLLLVQFRREGSIMDHTVGGHVDAGETYDAAVVREASEEIGMVPVLKRVGMFYADERIPTRKGQNIMHWFGLYEAKLDEQEVAQIKVSEREVEKLVPMKLRDIREMMVREPMKFTTGFMFMLNFYVKEKGLDISPVLVR